MLYNFTTTLSRSHKALILLIVDIVLLAVSILVGLAVVGQSISVVQYLSYLLFSASILAFASFVFDLHRVKLNSYEIQAVVNSAYLAVSICVVLSVLNIFLANPIPFATFFVMGMAFLVLVVFSRVGLRSIVQWIYETQQTRERVLIYGAGQTGQQLAAALFTDINYQPVAFIDDNPTLHGLNMSTLKVYAPSRVNDIVRRMGVDRIVLAMPSASQASRARIRYRLRGTGCEIQNLPSFSQIVSNGLVNETVQFSYSLTDLLGRSKFEDSFPELDTAYLDRVILVTGAGGSIGSELCRQIMVRGPKKIILLDHSEFHLYNIHRELENLDTDIEIVSVLGSVCEPGLIAEVFDTHGINVVFHAAAYKHLPIVEDNVIEGIRNNVLGTKIVADAARDNEVERFILVSTDKAVRPTSIMGSTKRLAELVVQDLAVRHRRPLYSMVRFGNVLGSSGSVIPLFEEQISRGGPVTVTHSDITRYFMTISEAARLVMTAGSLARGGDMFVLDMGKPVPIDTLARQMIDGAGFSVRDEHNPDGDIEIVYSGLRPGEKLHEELLIGSDMLTTPHPKILRAQEEHLSEIEIANALNELRRAISNRDVALAHSILEKWVEKQPDQITAKLT
jgi:FlaA1/EpsC-like NDP-sugar epimerase